MQQQKLTADTPCSLGYSTICYDIEAVKIGTRFILGTVLVTLQLIFFQTGKPLVPSGTQSKHFKDMEQ